MSARTESRRGRRMAGGWLCAALSALPIALGAAGPAAARVAPAEAEDAWYDAALHALEFEPGQEPQERDWPWIERDLVPAYRPYVVLRGEGEAYVYDSRRTDGALSVGQRWRFSEEMVGHRLAVRAPAGAPVSGELYLPDEDLVGFTRHPFTLPAKAAREEAREGFLRGKERHYRDLVDAEYPGAGWFRYQAEEARRLRTGESSEVEGPVRGRRRWRTSDDELDDTLGLFSGGRALSENLQLDRELTASRLDDEQEDVHPIDEIEAVTTRAIDWTARIEGLEPELDPLARWVPHDQHALFFPSFAAMTSLVDEARESGTPLLHLLEPRSEDARTQERYERQLCLVLDGLARMLGGQAVASVALTGSDPYLRTGSDVALIFEASRPEALLAFVRARQKAALESTPGAEARSGRVGELEYEAVVAPDRSVCSYLARLSDGAICVTNSKAQLLRLGRVARGEAEALADQDEYVWFRHRYERGHADETAFLMLTDAAIRRWAGPRWRIGASRRTRAAAILSAWTAEHLDELVEGRAASAVLDELLPVPGGGAVRLEPEGVRSQVYGQLDFLTPIAELELERVTLAERDAYDRFRERYERNWRDVFDPIGVRISVEPERLGLDLTVIPLIAGTDYRQLVDVTRGAELPAGAGDAHPEALVHFAMSIDTDSSIFREIDGMASGMIPVRGEGALGWVGDHLAIYADADPFWAELGQSGDAEAFMEDNFHRTPVALQVGVRNPMRLAAFLVAFRTFAEGTSGDILIWETLEHAGRSYARVTVDEDMVDDEQAQSVAVYYVALRDALVVSLREDLIHRAIDRRSEEAPALEARPWLGASAALRATEGVGDLLRAAFGEKWARGERARAWKNLPILNEWARRFPGRDPVALHEEHWSVRLACPGGGAYEWDAEAGTMASTAHGHPGAPGPPVELPAMLERILDADLGLTFEQDGLRARAELRRRAR